MKFRGQDGFDNRGGYESRSMIGGLNRELTVPLTRALSARLTFEEIRK
jgi:hypothetical protein